MTYRNPSLSHIIDRLGNLEVISRSAREEAAALNKMLNDAHITDASGLRYHWNRGIITLKTLPGEPDVGVVMDPGEN